MTDSYGGDEKRKHESIFAVVDNAAHHLHTAKKMLVIMIITAMVLPPGIMIGSNVIAELMSDGEISEGPRMGKLISLLEQLEKGEISPKEYVEETRYVKSAPMYGGPGLGFYMSLATYGTFIFWIGYTVWQWIIVTKLNKKYDYAKKEQRKSDSKNSNKKDPHQVFFETLDNAMRHLNHTKKMFAILIIAAIIIPQLVIIGVMATTVAPIQTPMIEKFDLILEQLENDEITIPEYVEELKEVEAAYRAGEGPVFYVVMIMMSLSLAWLAYGIRQWMILTKWNKNYQGFKTRDNEINRKLG